MKTVKKRALAFLMAVLVVMTTVFGNVDYSVKAEETTTYTKVTSVDDITAGGEFVLVAANGENYYAMGTATSGQNASTEVTIIDGKITQEGVPTWTIAQSDNGVSLAQGTDFLSYGGSGTKFAKSSGTPYTWNISMNNGTTRFMATTGTNRCIGYSENTGKFGPFSTTNTSGYVFDLLVYKAGTGENPSEPDTPVVETCAAVTASVTAGDVEAGTKVELACSTEGATILYNTDGTTNYSTYAEAITINETTTISARATKDGYNDSAVATFKYTVKAAATPLENGDRVVFYNDNSGMVMTSVASGSKLSGVAATVNAEDQTLQVVKKDSNAALVDGIAVFDVALDENGYYTFTCNGKYLTSGATGSSLTLEDVASDYSLWKLEDASASGKYLIKSVNAQYSNKSQYIEWYNAFTTYSFSSSKESIYTFSFHAMPTVVEALANPSIAPIAGEVEKDTVVTITNNEDGATVYYTVDGSEPTNTSDMLPLE